MIQRQPHLVLVTISEASTSIDFDLFSFFFWIQRQSHLLLSRFRNRGGNKYFSRCLVERMRDFGLVVVFKTVIYPNLFSYFDRLVAGLWL